MWPYVCDSTNICCVQQSIVALLAVNWRVDFSLNYVKQFYPMILKTRDILSGTVKYLHFVHYRTHVVLLLCLGSLINLKLLLIKIDEITSVLEYEERNVQALNVSRQIPDLDQ